METCRLLLGRHGTRCRAHARRWGLASIGPQDGQTSCSTSPLAGPRGGRTSSGTRRPGARCHALAVERNCWPAFLRPIASTALSLADPAWPLCLPGAQAPLCTVPGRRRMRHRASLKIARLIPGPRMPSLTDLTERVGACWCATRNCAKEALLREQVAALTQERDSLKSRLTPRAPCRCAVDRLPAETSGHKENATWKQMEVTILGQSYLLGLPRRRRGHLLRQAVAQVDREMCTIPRRRQGQRRVSAYRRAGCAQPGTTNWPKCHAHRRSMRRTLTALSSVWTRYLVTRRPTALSLGGKRRIPLVHRIRVGPIFSLNRCSLEPGLGTCWMGVIVSRQMNGVRLTSSPESPGFRNAAHGFSGHLFQPTYRLRRPSRGATGGPAKPIHQWVGRRKTAFEA